MSFKSLPLVVLLFCAVFMCFAQNQPVELTAQVGSTFRFAFLGDTRFTNPKDTRDSNATVRQTLVQAIADARPAFVSIGGDIVYHGDDANDWKTWDVETAIDVRSVGRESGMAGASVGINAVNSGIPAADRTVQRRENEERSAGLAVLRDCKVGRVRADVSDGAGPVCQGSPAGCLVQALLSQRVEFADQLHREWRTRCHCH